MAPDSQGPAGPDDRTIISGGTQRLDVARIGNYIVLGRIGSGGMGTVYKAHDPTLDRIVAIKLLPPTFVADAHFVARFKQEAAAAARFSHQNLVQVYVAGEDGGAPFIAMEFVAGESLRHRIERAGPLPVAEALTIAAKVAKALQYAWDKARLVHRDIKPDNILLALDGEVKVADFGLAKAIQSAAIELTQPGIVMGSPHYMSPEQGRGDKDVDFRSDIYSLGCTLYHMLFGRPPYAGTEHLATLIYRHVHETPPDLSSLRPECPARVAAIVRQMMAQDRDKRYADYGRLVADLDAARAGWGHPLRSLAGIRKRFLLAGAGVAAVGVAVGLALGPWWKGPVRGPASPVAWVASDDDFVREVSGRPATDQVARVMARLKQLNPGFDGNATPRIEGNAVVDLFLQTTAVSNIAPVRAFAKLRGLNCWGGSMTAGPAPPREGILADLSPLRGMPLVELKFPGNPVADLSSLAGMPLQVLWCWNSKVMDLSPLKGMPLVELGLDGTRVADLTPLKGMALRRLEARVPFLDFSPLREMKSLEEINHVPAAEFWRGPVGRGRGPRDEGGRPGWPASRPG